MDALSAPILKLQGDGDYAGGAEARDELGRRFVRSWRSDLARIASRNIPVDVTFRQGKDVLGL